MTMTSGATDDDVIQWKRGNMLGKGAYGTVREQADPGCLQSVTVTVWQYFHTLTFTLILKVGRSHWLLSFTS